MVNDGGDDVEDEEDHRQEREVAMKSRGYEARPAEALEAGDAEDSQHHHGREEQQADGAGTASRLPEVGGAHEASG